MTKPKLTASGNEPNAPDEMIGRIPGVIFSVHLYIISEKEEIILGHTEEHVRGFNAHEFISEAHIIKQVGNKNPEIFAQADDWRVMTHEEIGNHIIDGHVDEMIPHSQVPPGMTDPLHYIMAHGEFPEKLVNHLKSIDPDYECARIASGCDKPGCDCGNEKLMIRITASDLLSLNELINSGGSREENLEQWVEAMREKTRRENDNG
jgi:hypothetical protein